MEPVRLEISDQKHGKRTIDLNIRPRNEPPRLTTQQDHRTSQILRVTNPLRI